MMITVGYYEAPAVFKVCDDLSNLRLSKGVMTISITTLCITILKCDT